MNEWHYAGIENGWTMPCVPRWKRLPIIRHIRTLWGSLSVAFWYALGPGSIGIETGYDDWVLYGMWRGLERTPERGSAP